MGWKTHPRSSALPSPAVDEAWGKALQVNVRVESDQSPVAYDGREHYTKYEYRIPMRDGVRLFTSVLVPKDTSATYPFMIVRTPFGIEPYGADEYSPPAVHTDTFLKA